MQLHIYQTSLHMIRDVSPIIQQIAKHDVDLARQLRRSSTSIPLNINEGCYARGRNGVARLQTAAAEASESTAAIEVAQAAGYIGREAAEGVLDHLDHIRAVLWKLTH